MTRRERILASVALNVKQIHDHHHQQQRQKMQEVPRKVVDCCLESGRVLPENQTWGWDSRMRRMEDVPRKLTMAQ